MHCYNHIMMCIWNLPSCFCNVVLVFQPLLSHLDVYVCASLFRPCHIYKADHEHSEDEGKVEEEQNLLGQFFVDAVLADNCPLELAQPDDDVTRPGKHLCNIDVDVEAFQSADEALRTVGTLVQAPVQAFLKDLLPGQNLDFLFS